MNFGFDSCSYSLMLSSRALSVVNCGNNQFPPSMSTSVSDELLWSDRLPRTGIEQRYSSGEAILEARSALSCRKRLHRFAQLAASRPKCNLGGERLAEQLVLQLATQSAT